jgi:hypothetical protein
MTEPFSAFGFRLAASFANRLSAIRGPDIPRGNHLDFRQTQDKPWVTWEASTCSSLGRIRTRSVSHRRRGVSDHQRDAKVVA